MIIPIRLAVNWKGGKVAMSRRVVWSRLGLVYLGG